MKYSGTAYVARALGRALETALETAVETSSRISTRPSAAMTRIITQSPRFAMPARVPRGKYVAGPQRSAPPRPSGLLLAGSGGAHGGSPWVRSARRILVQSALARGTTYHETANRSAGSDRCAILSTVQHLRTAAGRTVSTPGCTLCPGRLVTARANAPARRGPSWITPIRPRPGGSRRASA